MQRINDVFIMDKICETIRDKETLSRINNVSLWLKVSRLSDIASDDGKKIEQWAMHGPPAASKIEWPKRREPTAANLNLWCQTVRGVFCGLQGIYPSPLGKDLIQGTPCSLMQPASTFEEIIEQYPGCYKKLLGKSVLGNEQIVEIIHLLKRGHLYAGSDGSVKNKIGSHACAFTSGRTKGKIWGGELQLLQGHRKKCPLFGLSTEGLLGFY